MLLGFVFTLRDQRRMFSWAQELHFVTFQPRLFICKNALSGFSNLHCLQYIEQNLFRRISRTVVRGTGYGPAYSFIEKALGRGNGCFPNAVIHTPRLS